ncbi:DUF4157 domain-containing protein [Streptomyces sp. NPDC048590]|uniref:eCIS core domain-containing protein n=1 Tax=Streptomyces sp. NPDC048590 TaxID=3365574 RepID=UPI00372014B5
MRARENPQHADEKQPGRPPVRTSEPAGAVAGNVSPGTLAALQRAAGNASVVQMLRRTGRPEPLREHEHGEGCGHPQAGPAVQRSSVHAVLRSPGAPLDEDTRTEMESRLGADFSDVRLHTGSAAKASAAEVGARAYTSGSHVVIGEGGGDKHTLAHELTHVIQQRRGPVAGTDDGTGLRVSDPDDRFEKAAEANATRAMSRPVQRRPSVKGGERDRTPAARDIRVQRVTTRDGSGNPPLPAWDKVAPRWTSPVYGPVNPNGGPLDRTGGSGVTLTLGPSINSPEHTYSGSTPAADQCTLVNELNQRDGSGWVKGHLWNDNLGGPGESRNLTPMTNSTNGSFNRSFEEPLKRMLRACTHHAQYTSNTPVWYGVTFNVRTYGQMSTDPNKLEFYVPEGVEYTASYVQMDRATQTVTAVTTVPAGFPPVIT